MTDQKYTKAEMAAFYTAQDDVEDRARVDRRLNPLDFRVLSHAIHATYPPDVRGKAPRKYLAYPGRQFFAGPSVIAEEIGSKRNPVQKSLKRLETTGYLICISRGRRGYSKKSATSYKLGDGLFRCDDSEASCEASADYSEASCEASVSERSLHEGFSRNSEASQEAPSILEARGSTSKANPTRTTQEGTRSDVELDGDQPDRPSAGSPACASAHAHSGEYSSWHTRSRAADLNSRRDDSTPDPDLAVHPDLAPDPTVMQMFAGLAGDSPWWMTVHRDHNSRRDPACVEP